MPYIIVGVLLVALLWLGRQYVVLRRGVRLLAESIRQRRSYLDADRQLSDLHPSWSLLASEASVLVNEINRLSHQQADQLTQLETTLGSLQEAVLIVDRDNYILLANKALLRILPSAGPLPGKRIESVLRSARFLDFLNLVRSGQARPQTEIEFVHDGRSVWLETTGASIPGSDDRNGPWILFVLHDVTRQRHLETMRREFVANVSHELKTPLSVIKGYAETLAEDHSKLSAADLDQFVRAILRHAERLSAIVEDLLTLSRLEDEEGSLRAKLAPQSLADLLRSVEAEFFDDLRSNGFETTMIPPCDAIQVEVDSLRMHQVFANLFENARKYTPVGTRIEVTTVAGEGEVVIRVSDNGPGIPRADLLRIFERFYRVEKGRSREKGGTGLGLSIAKHIVQMHRGRIWAESELGKGLAIVFTLPLTSLPPSRPNSDSAGESHLAHTRDTV